VGIVGAGRIGRIHVENRREIDGVVAAPEERHRHRRREHTPDNRCREGTSSCLCKSL
jgi:hypothetical protein